MRSDYLGSLLLKCLPAENLDAVMQQLMEIDAAEGSDVH